MTNKTIANNKTHFSLGADPEVLIALQSGIIVSSIPVLKRDKNNPIVLDAENGVNLYADNSLAEFTLKPANNKEEWMNVFRVALQKTQEYLKQSGHKIQIKSAHTFGENELEAAYGIDPQQIGCQPQFDAWSLSMDDLGQFQNNMR